MGPRRRPRPATNIDFRTGFRDFRIVNGYFHLNGKRVFLKSTHGNWYDPVAIQGTPRTMKYLDKDFTQLKKAGFNTLRLIISAAPARAAG